ncbi:KxYKxGKxW signal peptide domain-containing protein, partial [Secundilactobacillus folii]
MEKDYRKVSKNNGLIRKEKEQASFKMYKAKKVWLFAGMFLLTSLGMGTSVAYADTSNTGNSTDQPAVTATANPNKDTSNTNGATSAAPNSNSAADTPTTTANPDQNSAATGPSSAAADPSSVTPSSSGAPSDSNNVADAASNQATVTKVTTNTTTTSNVSVKPTITNGDTTGNTTGETGTTTPPDTSGALLKTSIGGKAGTAENSATTGVGQTESNDQNVVVNNANKQTDRQAGDYGTTGVTDASNDNLDDSVTVNGQATNAPADDIINDQGAVSSDSKNAQTRGTIIYVNGQNTAISISAAGSNEHGSTVGIPSNLTNVSVGTFDVTDVSSVGITIQDEATKEQFQITDPKLSSQYSVGDKITNMAVVNTNFNGSGMQYLTTPVTETTQGVSSFLSGGGTTALNTLIAAVQAAKAAVDTAAASPIGGTDVSTFDSAIQTYLDGLNSAVKSISQTNDYGSNLAKQGVAETTLEPVTIADNEATVTSQESVADSLTNIVSSYIDGWTNGISNTLVSAIGATPDANGETTIQKIGKSLGNSTLVSTFTNLLSNALTSAADTVTKGISSATNGISSAVSGVAQSVIDGGIGVSQTVAVPLTFTDPDLSSNTPGAFTGETFNTATKLYNTSTSSNTTIVYQNVDKSQLKAAAAKSGVSADLVSAAQKVLDDDNASQQDVDKALLAIEPDVETTFETTTASQGTQVVGHLTLNPVTGTTVGEKAEDVLTDNLSQAVNSDVPGLKLSGLTASDFTVEPTATGHDNKGNDTYTYQLSDNGIKDVTAAVNALVNGAADTSYTIADLDKLSSTISVPVTAVDSVTPTNGNTIYNVTGNTTPDTVVTVTDNGNSDGKPVGTATSDENGDFTV